MGSHLDLEPVRHSLAVRDGIHHLNRLVSGVGGADVPSHRHAVWKLKSSLFIATAVALWIAAGAGLKEVATRAGHTSVSFALDRYGHLHPEADTALRDRLDALYVAGAQTEPGVVIELRRDASRPQRGPERGERRRCVTGDALTC